MCRWPLREGVFLPPCDRGRLAVLCPQRRSSTCVLPSATTAMKYDLNKPMLGKPAVRRWPHGMVGGVLACAFGLVLGCGASRPLRQSFDAAMADQREDAVLREDSVETGFETGFDQRDTDSNVLSPCLSASECPSMACDPTTMACAARCHFAGTSGPAVCGPGFSCMPEQPLGAAIG